MQVLVGIIISLILFISILIFLRSRGSYRVSKKRDYIDINFLINECYLNVTEQCTVDTRFKSRESIITGTVDENDEAILYSQEKLESSRQECRYGNQKAKKYMKAIVRGVVSANVNEENYHDIIPDLHGSVEQLKYEDMTILWEIFIYRIAQREKGKVFKYLDLQYQWFTEKVKPSAANPNKMVKKCEVSVDEFLEVFKREINPEILTLDDYINVITQVVYSKYLGYDLLDSFIDLDMSEFQAGVSGTNTQINTNYEGDYRDLKSIWVVLHRNNLHLNFLEFESHDRMKAVIRHLGEKQDTIDLTESNPTKSVNDARGRRVTVSRPSAADVHSVFYRVDNIEYLSKETVINQKTHDGREKLKNWDLPYELLYFIVRGRLTTAVTGDQGSGKTTLCKAMFEDLPYINIRVIEEVTELYLKELYPDRNVISLMTTQFRSFNDLLTHIKKQSGDITVVGEIANKVQGGQLIEAATVGSRNTIFTCHPDTPQTLVTWLAESRMMSTGYNDMRSAVHDVTSLLRMDVHPVMWQSNQYGFDFGNTYVIERITSILPRDPKPFVDTNDNFTITQAINANTEVLKESFKRQQEALMECYNICEFDKEKGMYVPGKWFSYKDQEILRQYLTVEDIERLQRLKDKYYGGGPIWGI